MKRSSYNEKNTSENALCICLTPLHVLIAEKVAEKKGAKFDKGIFMSYQNDHKTQAYFKRMQIFCEATEFVLLPRDEINSRFKHIKIILQRWQFRLKFIDYRRYANVYLPTSYNVYLMILFANLVGAKLHTFDDGILNIAYEEIIAEYRISKLAKKIYTKITGVLYSIDDLVGLSTKHYSIYPNSENVCKNLEFVALTNTSLAESPVFTKTIKLFIGPSPEADQQLWNKVNNKILEIRPDEFLPHPRDVNQMAKNVNYAETNLIAEDYVIKVLESNPDATVEVYGIQSSALIHLAQLPNVEVYSFIDNNPDNLFIRGLLATYSVKLL